MRPPPLRACAFTLIELLVVISIVAILAGMLLPAVSAVRDAAQASRCAANQRQLAASLLAYAGDNDGLLPPGIAWSGTSAPAWAESWDRFTFPYLETAGVYGCPVDRISPVSTRTLNGITGTTRRSYSMPGLNAVLAGGWRERVLTWWDTTGSTCSAGTAVARLADSSGTALLVDRYASANNWLNNSGAMTYGPVDLPSRQNPALGHRGGDGYVFCDGHSEKLSAQRASGSGGFAAVDQAGGARGVWTLAAGD